MCSWGRTVDPKSQPLKCPQIVLDICRLQSALRPERVAALRRRLRTRRGERRDQDHQTDHWGHPVHAAEKICAQTCVRRFY